jgi:RNA ligase
MVNLTDLLDIQELETMLENGRINRQVHPDLPLYILNYSAKAQYEGEWSNSERVCRGLIVEEGTNEIVARGPSKFMNYGQPGAPETTPETFVIVTRKEDGSLGIGWKYDGHYGVATRGSFASDQAIHATALLTDDDKANIDYATNRNLSRIWEIVYPENRIVLDYGNRDELIPLGTVNNASGIIQYRPQSVKKADGKIITLAEALTLPIPADEEGYVLDICKITDINLGKLYEVSGHVKLKGNEYKILHGLLTNTNARRIWVELAARDCHQWMETPDDWANKLGHNPADFFYVKVDKDITETLLTNVPDEFYTWVTKQIDSINDKVIDLIAQSLQLAGRVSMISDKRARFELVKGHPMTKEILNHADSTDREDVSKIVLKAWKLAKPAGNETPFKTQEED